MQGQVRFCSTRPRLTQVGGVTGHAHTEIMDELPGEFLSVLSP
jgi:hypothetical protein